MKNREIGYDIPICGIFKLHGEAMRLRPNFVWVMKVDKNVSVTVFIRAKHFQHFKTRDTFKFGRRMLLLLLFFFYLETDRFLPIIGVKSRKSDWN